MENPNNQSGQQTSVHVSVVTTAPVVATTIKRSRPAALTRTTATVTTVLMMLVGLLSFSNLAILTGAAAKQAPTKEEATAHFPSNLYLKQLVAGDDIALVTPKSSSAERNIFSLAVQMKNFVYLVGDRETGEAVVIDGCWDVDGIERVAKADGMKVERFIATHYHWDHIGGPIKGRGMNVPGVKEWFGLGYKVSMPKWELEAAAHNVGMPAEGIDAIDEGTVISVGGFDLAFLHTPGHSPGSMVIQIKQQQTQQGVQGASVALVTGDTVFPGSCGRLDLPESEPLKMWDSLQKVASLDPQLPIFPGHGYSGWGSTVAHEKESGLLRPVSNHAFNRMMGISGEL